MVDRVWNKVGQLIVLPIDERFSNTKLREGSQTGTLMLMQTPLFNVVHHYYDVNVRIRFSLTTHID